MFALGVYWVARTVCEFFRQPDPRFASCPNELGTVWAGLSMGQLLSIFMLVGGVALVVTRWKHRVADEPWRPSEQREPASAA